MSKNVVVTCSTYRNPEGNDFIRTYGIIALINQMANQDFDGKIGVSIIDDSPTPHSFAQTVSQYKPDLLSYVHVNTRQQLRDIMLEEAPEYAKLVPSDDILRQASILLLKELRDSDSHIAKADIKLAAGDFQLSEDEWDQVIGRKDSDPTGLAQLDMFLNNALTEEVKNNEEALFWKERLLHLRGYAQLVPFEDDYPIQTNIYKQIFGERPTIGMKKNAGNALGCEKFGRPDAIVYADDDDQHAPDYVRHSVNALGENDFTRMTHYMTYIYNKDASEAQAGIFSLDIRKSGNGYWMLTNECAKSPMYFWLPNENKFDESRTGKKFSRPVMMAWPILSHEGALHTYSYDMWEKSIDLTGGATPVSFCEDIIGFRMLKDFYGRDFKDVHTPITPGEEKFIRIADGNNASIIEVSRHIDKQNMPEWAQEALGFLHAAQPSHDRDPYKTQLALARNFVNNGSISARDLNTQQDKRYNF